MVNEALIACFCEVFAMPSAPPGDLAAAPLFDTVRPTVRRSLTLSRGGFRHGS